MERSWLSPVVKAAYDKACADLAVLKKRHAELMPKWRAGKITNEEAQEVRWINRAVNLIERYRLDCIEVGTVNPHTIGMALAKLNEEIDK